MVISNSAYNICNIFVFFDPFLHVLVNVALTQRISTNVCLPSADVIYECPPTRRSHALEAVLNPATHTADPLDHRTSWLLGRVLGALGYSHLAPERREQVT